MSTSSRSDHDGSGSMPATLTSPLNPKMLIAGSCGATFGAVMGKRMRRSPILSGAWIGFASWSCTWVHLEIKRRTQNVVHTNQITSAQQSVASGGIAGLVFGLAVGRNVVAASACSVGGTALAVSSEYVHAKYTKWRLDQMIELRHVEFQEPEGRSAHDRINSDERPWWWPEWMPIQPTHANTEEHRLEERIEALQLKLAALPPIEPVQQEQVQEHEQHQQQQQLQPSLPQQQQPIGADVDQGSTPKPTHDQPSQSVMQSKEQRNEGAEQPKQLEEEVEKQQQQ
eukprot:m.62731 g.62731  ORF g.62731 m.62731 type:complete len:284 (-) comp23194_c0_seq2:37-888(-)